MSVSFYAMTAEPYAEKREPCLCAQMSEHFGAFVRGERTDWEALEPDASQNCQRCDGTGVEVVPVDLRPQVNFSNGNAQIVLKALGLPHRETELCGECDLATLKRGIIRARNVEHPEVLREHTEGRAFVGYGYTREDLMRAIDDLDQVVQIGEQRGATQITWS